MAAANKKRRRILNEDEDEDEDDESSKSGNCREIASSSQSRRLSQNQNQINHHANNDIEALANDLVHFILVADQKKIPIKKTDINKHIMKEKTRLTNEVLDLARNKLKQVFDFELKTVEKKSSTQYIVVNREKNPRLKWSDEVLDKSALLLITLAHIFMAGNRLTEGQLWTILKKLHINPDQPHAVFGDVSKIINQEFKQQLYLEVEKVTTCDPPTLEYRWGQRAELEVSKIDVLQFVCSLYGDNMQPENWTEQFRAAQSQRRSTLT